MAVWQGSKPQVYHSNVQQYVFSIPRLLLLLTSKMSIFIYYIDKF